MEKKEETLDIYRLIINLSFEIYSSSMFSIIL